MFRKGLVLGIILLFVGMIVIPSSGIIIVEEYDMQDKRTYLNNCIFGETIYVDDDNTEGPWDGTQEHPYQYIQDGIDAANDDDTVFVYQGSYYENIVIEKGVKVIGEEASHTIIRGSGSEYAVSFKYAEYAELQKFTIENIEGGGYSYNGIHVCAYSNNIVISENIIVQQGWRDGIHVWISDNIMITNNIICNKAYGIQIRCSDDCVISGNIIQDNDDEEYGAGIYLFDAQRTLISGNLITDNVRYGIEVCRGSQNTEIIGNDIRENGIGVRFMSDSIKNTITRNNLVDNIECDATFGNSKRNRWIANYWGETPKNRYLKIIVGFVYLDYGIWSYKTRATYWFELFPSSKPYLIP